MAVGHTACRKDPTAPNAWSAVRRDGAGHLEGICQWALGTLDGSTSTWVWAGQAAAEWGAHSSREEIAEGG